MTPNRKENTLPSHTYIHAVICSVRTTQQKAMVGTAKRRRRRRRRRGSTRERSMEDLASRCPDHQHPCSPTTFKYDDQQHIPLAWPRAVIFPGRRLSSGGTPPLPRHRRAAKPSARPGGIRGRGGTDDVWARKQAIPGAWGNDEH